MFMAVEMEREGEEMTAKNKSAMHLQQSNVLATVNINIQQCPPTISGLHSS